MFVCRAESVKKIEENAALAGTSFYTMMENAGFFAVEEICKRKDVKGKKIIVYCGSGNNGGDGYVAARLLMEKGADCFVVPFGEPLTETAKKAKNSYNGSFADENLNLDDADIIIDALFGTGLKRNLEGRYLEAVNKINESAAYKVALDIPSGLFADSGEESPCIKADLTVTFIAYKLCHLMFPARNFCGEIALSRIGIEDSAFKNIEIIGKIIEQPVFKKRESNTHKGTYGTASLVVGSYGMAGAAILSLKGALMSGVGIAKATVHNSIYPIVTVACPEAVCNVYSDDSDLEEVAGKAILSDAVLIGCGLSKGELQRRLLYHILSKADKKLIIDADGINMLSDNIECIKQSSADIVLTPHPAEMSRLLKVSVAEIEKDRIYYGKKAAKDLSCTVVLKGAVTLVCHKNGEVYFNLTGNPSMAKGGSGDSLSGIIVSLASQGFSLEEAAGYGVYIHGMAGDKARDEFGEISSLPTDLINYLPWVFKKLGEKS